MDDQLIGQQMDGHSDGMTAYSYSDSDSDSSDDNNGSIKSTNKYAQMLLEKCDFKFMVGSVALAIVLTGGFYMVRQLRK
jgi:hypothetical protein